MLDHVAIPRRVSARFRLEISLAGRAFKQDVAIPRRGSARVRHPSGVAVVKALGCMSQSPAGSQLDSDPMVNLEVEPDLSWMSQSPAGSQLDSDGVSSRLFVDKEPDVAIPRRGSDRFRPIGNVRNDAKAWMSQSPAGAQLDFDSVVVDNHVTELIIKSQSPAGAQLDFDGDVNACAESTRSRNTQQGLSSSPHPIQGGCEVEVVYVAIPRRLSARVRLTIRERCSRGASHVAIPRRGSARVRPWRSTPLGRLGWSLSQSPAGSQLDSDA